MTDKEIFEKLEAEIERLENYENESVTSSDTRFGWIHGKTFALTSIRVLLDSMQKEPKECMYSKDNYTDEDRKALCDGCEEECRFNKKEESINNGLDLGCGVIWKNEEPVSVEQVKKSLISQHEEKTCKENGNSLTQEPISDDLEEAIDTYLATYFGSEKEKRDWPFLKKMAIHFAQWQKEQLMKDSVLCGVDGWFINNKRNCRKNGRFYKYYESTITHDKPLPMENGKDYRLITIKEG